MRFIITGANGFIGRNLCDYLSKDQTNYIYAFVKNSNEDISMLHKKNIKIIYCDLLDIDSFKNQHCTNVDIFFNLAWIGVNSKSKENFDIQYLNIKFVHNAILLAKKLNVNKFIGIGSVSEFAYAKHAITGQECPTPCDYYSAAKISSKYFCEVFCEKNDLNFNRVYITSIYGPGRDDGNLISYTIKCLLNNITPEFTSLDQYWDYIYIDDLVKALFLIGIKGVNKKSYVVGSGFNCCLKDYVSLIRDLIDKNALLKIGEKPYKTSKIDNSIVNISELCKDTGYKTETRFEEGILQTIKYLKEKNQ